MPVGAENIDQIYEFLTYMFDAEVSGKWATATGYNPVSIGADDFLDEASKKLFKETYPQDTLDNRLWWWPPAEAWYPEIRNEYVDRSEEHTSELQSLMRISYAVFCLKKKTT